MEGMTSIEKLHGERQPWGNYNEGETSIEKLHGGRNVHREITWRERHP